MEPLPEGDPAVAPLTRRQRRRARIAARSMWLRWLIRTGIFVAVLVLIVVGAGLGYFYYRTGQVKHVDTPAVVKVHGPTENILLIGSTSRCAAKAIKRYRQECAAGVTGINSDVVLVAHLNGKTNRVSLLSIPRDTFVPGARSGSFLCGTTSPLTPGTCANRVDSSLVEGPNQLVEAVENDFGIPINHVIDLNFSTFQNVVNALGGVRLYFSDRLVDRSSFLNITRTGCQLLNGTEALALVRARHLYYFTRGQTPNYLAIQDATTPDGPWYTPDSGGSYDGTGDLGRIVRVHIFLKALAQQVLARGLGNPITDNNLIGAVAPNLTVDNTLSATALLHLALDFRHADLGAAPELTLPTITYGQTYYYYGADYGDVIFPSQPQDRQVVNAFLGRSDPAVSPATISVSVVDGTQSTSQTAAVAAGLRRLGYRVMPATASQYVGPVSETTVLYGPGHLAQAERVIASLKGAAVLGRGKPVGGAEVSIVTGSDLAVVSPSRSTPSTTTPGAGSSSGPSTTTASRSTTTTTPSGVAGTPVENNPNYSYNPPASPIPPWDPRSCPSGR